MANPELPVKTGGEAVPAAESAEDRAIADIQKATRQRIFTAVIQNEGQLPDEYLVTDNLKAQKDERVAIVKEAAIKAREVVLEQKRLVSILKDAVSGAVGRGSLKTVDLAAAGVPKSTQEELMRALNSLFIILQKPVSEIFDADLDIDTYTDELKDYLARNISRSASTAEDVAEDVKAFFEAEIALGIKALEESRKRPVLAHRARGFGKDEASREGLRGALDHKVSEMEFDIRMSSDHVPIIHHNATLGNLADRHEAIHELSSGELAAVTLSNGEHLATLREFFESVRESGNEVTKINVDIKDFDEKMLDAILALIKEFKFEHRVQVVSWFPQVLQYMHEKEPTIQYSLSYYPTLRGVSKWLFNKINGYYRPVTRGIPGMNLIASWVAKRRAKLAGEGHPEIQGTGSEQITDAYILRPNMHWETTKDIARESGASLVGKHTLAAGNAPTEENTDMDRMARVLRNGSVNVMAVEELLGDRIFKIPLIGKFFKMLVRRRVRAMTGFVQECETNGVKVNLFDLRDPEKIDAHFAHYEEQKLQAGVVYSSNPAAVARLTGERETA